ncbi:MAG: NUDIX hydrolase [Candidatus Moraniibacteriota bacterium]
MSEELAIIPTVAVVVFKNDNPELVCLVEHLPGAHHVTGTFGLPAGRVQVGEKNIDAGVRELQEETGLTASSTDMIFLSQYEARIQQKEGVSTSRWMHTFVLTMWGISGVQGRRVHSGRTYMM